MLYILSYLSPNTIMRGVMFGFELNIKKSSMVCNILFLHTHPNFLKNKIKEM
jgi:hypothetical protein